MNMQFHIFNLLYLTRQSNPCCERVEFEGMQLECLSTSKTNIKCGLKLVRVGSINIKIVMGGRDIFSGLMVCSTIYRKEWYGLNAGS